MSGAVIELAAQQPAPMEKVLAVVRFDNDGGTPAQSWIVDWMSGGEFVNLAGMLRASPGLRARVTHYAPMPERDNMVSVDLVLPPVARWVVTRCERADGQAGYMVDRWLGGPEPFDVLGQFKRANPFKWRPWAVAHWADLPALPLLGVR